MKENTWTVIQFLDDGTVEAVPSTWIQGERCHWPSFAHPKLHNAIQKCEPLNTCWPSHPVKIFRNATYGDYMKARRKAKVAEDTSDLNTEAEECDKKRKRIQKILSSSDECIDENILAPPPKIKKFKKKVGEQASEIENYSVKSNMPDGPSTSVDKVLPGPSTEDDRPLELNENNETNNSQINFEASAIPLPACQSCIEKDKTLKILTQQGHILRGLITDTLSEVKALRKDLNNVHTVEKSTSLNFFNNPELKFPLDTDEEFDKIERFLQNEEDFNNAAVELSKLGGSTIYDFVKRALHLILTNELSLKYSWLGRKGKIPFQKSNLARLLLRSSEMTGLAKSQKDVEVSIQTWLRRASDRRNTVRVNKKF